MAMKLSTGRVAFPIEFDNGDEEFIYFNPTDPNLAFRMKEFERKITAKTKTLESIESADLDVDAELDLMKEFQDEVLKELDYAFDSEISKVVFKHCSPFAVVDGEYFVVLFMKLISPEIEKHVKKANEKANENMKKHLGKYIKK